MPYPSDRTPLRSHEACGRTTQHGPAPRISTLKNPMGGILRMEAHHMPIEAKLALTDYASDMIQPSLSEYQPYDNDKHKVMPSLTKDSARAT